MARLKDIYSLLNYKEIKEQIAYTKWFASCGGFNQPDYYFFEEKETDSLRYKRRANLVAQALPIWQKTPFKKYYEEHKGRVISDQEALELLQTEINPSWVLSFIWFANMVDVYFLRKEFEGEGIKSDINENRWERKDEIEVNLLKYFNQEDITYQLFQCAKSLHLIDELPWPEDQVFHHIILQSSMDHYVKERVIFLRKNLQKLTGKFEGKINLYLCSGARGASNSEEYYTALVLADMFKMPDKVNVIRNFLKKHQAKDDLLKWNKNLSAVKKGLMLELDAKEWPRAPDSYYYYPGHKEIYDAAAQRAGQQYLDCEGGPWPVPADLAKKILEEQFKDDADLLKEINLIPVVAMGKNGRLATMDDTLEKWLNQEGKIPVSEGNPVLIIGCNTMHFLPFVNYNLTHNHFFQDAILRTNLQNKLNQFNEIKEGKTTTWLSLQSSQWKVVGPEAKSISFEGVKDSLAKCLFRMRENIQKVMNYCQYTEENIFESQAPAALNITLAKRMIFYHQHQEYLFLANSAIDLALSFYCERDLIKTSGLFNFALNVLLTVKDENIKKLIKTLYTSTLVNMRNFVLITLQKLSYPEKYVDIAVLQSYDEKNRSRLDLIRQKILKSFKRTSPGSSKQIAHLYHVIFEKMNRFYLSLTDQAQALLGKRTNAIAHVSMGSNSRKQATPFSDIELCILVEKDSDFKFAKYLTQLVLMEVLQLRETVLTSLVIWVLDNAGNQFYLSKSLFDSYTKEGVCFDQNIPQSCKTPLGKKDRNGVVYRLIATPQSMSSQFSSLQGYRLDPYLPQLIRLTRFAGGNVSLYNQFIDCLKDNKKLHFPSYSLMLLNNDIDKYIPCLDEIKNIPVINHKKYFFRPINIFLDNILTALAPIQNLNSYEKIDFLFNFGIIDCSQKIQLTKVLNYVLYLRLHQHFKFKEQKIHIENTSPMFSYFCAVQNTMKSLLVDLADSLKKKEILLMEKEYQMSLAYNFINPYLKPRASARG